MQQNLPTHIKELIATLDSQLIGCDDPLLSKTQVVSEHQDVVTERYLFLQKGEFFFGILMESITELSPLGSVTSLPNLPAWIYGVTSLRGDVVSAIDLPTYFNWTTTVGKVGEHIVAVQYKDVRVGICVDRIVGSGNVDPVTEIQTQLKPDENRDIVFEKAYYLNGQMCCILDIQELLTENKMFQW